MTPPQSELARLFAPEDGRPLCGQIESVIGRLGLRPGRPGDDGQSPAATLYWLLRMAQRTAEAPAESFNPEDKTQVEMLEARLADRPAATAEHGQLLIDAASVYRRAKIARTFLSEPQDEVLCVGDDDGVSVALACMGVRRLRVVDVDARVLGYLREQVESLGASFCGVELDIFESPLPKDFRRRARVAITDPLRSLEACLQFLLTSAAGLMPSSARILWCDDPEWNFDYELVAQAIVGTGFAQEQYFPSLHRYPLRPGDVPDLHAVASEFGLDEGWLQAVAGACSAWSSLTVLKRASPVE